jgi:response regulator RpfG family c-di-GMP phosphodiesterase
VPVLRSHVSDSLVQNALVAGYRGARRKVLVVDDVPQSRTMLLEVLSTVGFEVDEAVNGADALEVVTRFRPDLVMWIALRWRHGRPVLILRRCSNTEILQLCVQASRTLTPSSGCYSLRFQPTS